MADRDLAIAAFKAEAQMAYSTASKLRDKVMEISGVTGESQRFPVVGTAEAEAVNGTDPVMAQAIRDAKPTAYMTPQGSYARISKFDTFFTNVDLARQRGRACTNGYGRKIDESIIEALKTYDGNAYSRDGLTATQSVKSGTANKYTKQGVISAYSNLMDEGIAEDAGEVCLVASWKHFESLGQITDFTSGDFVEKGAVGKGRLPELYGMNVVLIDFAGRRAGYGRLDENRGYVFAKNAVGLAVNEGEQMGIMDWDPDRRAWLVGSEGSFDATRVQNAGIIEIQLAT